MSAFKKAKTFIADNLQNILTGLGVEGMDKQKSSRFIETDLNYYELESAYSSDWLTGKVCDVPPFDMTREWRTFDGDLEPEKVLELEKAEREFKIRAKMQEALTLSRIYGGAGMVLNVDDGAEPWEPMVIDNIKKDGLRWIVVSDSQFLKPATFNHDPFSENYGFPEFYRMAPSSILIHYTRVIRFDGVPLPLAARRRNQYWGKSVIERLYTALRNAGSIQDNIGALVYEASVDIIKIPDMIDRVASTEGAEALTKRFTIAKLQKSVNRMLLLDTEEEYESHQQTFAGLQDMMQSYLNIVAGAADIPITRLLGQSPGGMNATGESDLRNYYDFISGQQETIMRTKLELLDQILYRSTFGAEPDTDVLSFKFDVLWQMTAKERADVQFVDAQRDAVYLDRAVLLPSVVAKQLMSTDTYDAVDAQFIKELEVEELLPDENDEEGGDQGGGNDKNNDGGNGNDDK